MGIFTMPSLGADMEAGTLVEWTVNPGDTVKRGDVVAVVETQKGAIEIEIFEEGEVTELTAQLGQELPVGAPLAVVLKPGEAPPESVGSVDAPQPAPEPDTLPEPAAPTPAPGTAIAPSPTIPVSPEAGPIASPAARVRAHELGVDLATVTGTGPGGVVVLGDVEGAGAATSSRQPELQKQPKHTDSPIEEMRKAIAAAMTRSKQTIPHFYLSETVDVDPAIRFLDARNADCPPTERVLLGAVFVRAATLAAAKVPVVNGHFTEAAGYQPSRAINTGVAVALRGGGLVAPALMDAMNLSLDETMAGMRDLVSRARAGRLRSSEMTMGTITVSSLGDTGAEAMTGVIFPPQVALVGLGAPHVRPWVVEDEIVPRHVVTLTVSADHRVSDGRQIARFIAAFEHAVQHPEEL
jgi:pyruvate dehydrogenase E2 component (dihydrolipoamide acetyltransferase)